MNNLVFLILLLVVLITITSNINFSNFSNLGSTGNTAKNNIYFIHIPKTSGSYITKLLKNNYLIKDDIKYKYNDNLHYNHLSPRYKPEINFNNYITSFMVVRNPYYRIISSYNYQRNRKNNIFFTDEEYNDINVYISNYLYDIQNNNINFNKEYHLVPQVEYLYDFYDNRVSNILHYENIKEEFNNFARKYSIDVVYDDTDYVNKTEDPVASFDDLNDFSKELIQKYYSEDFTTFGYSK